MRIPAHPNRTAERVQLKMTSMIDVIFLLLIFFVCTAGFRPLEELLPTNLSFPGSIAEAAVEPDPEIEDLDDVKVNVRWDGRKPYWEINEQRRDDLMQVRAVLAKVAQVRRDIPVILIVEGGVPVEHVVDVYDICRILRLDKVQFAASASLVPLEANAP